jgi:DNA helicase-2/ATP-dependent DNA helicase PcrA
MILVRSAFSGRSIEAALVAADIPYQFIGGVKLLESAHVKDLLSLLRIVVNHKDELAWMRFLTLWPGIGDVSASRMAAQCIGGEDLTDCLLRLKTMRKLPLSAPAVLAELCQCQHLVQQCLDLALELLTPQLAQNYKNQDWQRRVRDFELVKQLAERHSSIAGFLEEYVLEPISATQLSQTEDQDGVTLATIHSAKALNERCVMWPKPVSDNFHMHVRKAILIKWKKNGGYSMWP